jgi:uncharacterized membrane protein required for colicin V production
MWILYDLALVGIIAAAVIVNYKKGFLRVLLSVASFVVAIILAYMISGFFTNGGSTVISDAAQGTGNIYLESASSSRPLVFVVVFVIVSIVANMLSKAIQMAVDKIPIVGNLNQILGGLLGLLEGGVMAYAAVTICALIIAVTGESLEWMNSAVIDKTFLVSLVYRYTIGSLL